MEPISLIVGALVMGASEALKETASQAVQDSYQGLKSLVVEHWRSSKSEGEANILLEQLENDPETFQTPVEKTMQKIMPEPDPVLLEKAQALYKLIDETGFNARKYEVTVSKSQGVQVGDNNTQNNTFSGS